MSDQDLVSHAAPTMAGIKTGSLFLCRFDDRNGFERDVKEYNRRFCRRGFSIIPLYIKNDRSLVYTVRMDRLRRDLSNRETRKMLENAGYDCSDAAGCVRQLADRFENGTSFPHEVGLFLSYPAEDVQGFIENRAMNYKYSGMWKVYGDVESARRDFARYAKCTEAYKKTYLHGRKIDDLLVG